ncbi:MAG TPA: uroporphyrinogen decarboxylase family protein [Anaerolineales bacterium]|nr:uroporphyrinogen decarboxylase family protein [Anaerolineales bacterium]
MTSHRARLEECISGGLPDRPPVALWRHFPVDDQDPGRLATATAAFQRSFDFDFIKVTPASSFCLFDWGARDVWNGAVEGTREYSAQRVISEPEDWGRLPILEPEAGSLGTQLQCLEFLVKEFHPEAPLVQTIFSPLAQAKNLVGGENLLQHMRREPEALHAGLATISQTTCRFIRAAIKRGIEGIFYAVQHAQDAVMSEAEYLEFGKRYDLQVLEESGELWLNVLHIHGRCIMFDVFTDYPVAVLNWHDQETGPTLSAGLGRFQGAVCGGLARLEDLVLGTPEQIYKKAEKAILETGGRRFILGTGCVTPTNAPYGNILAARRSVEPGQPDGSLPGAGRGDRI